MFKKLRDNVGALILISILGLIVLGATYVNLGPTSLIDGDVGVTAGHSYYIGGELAVHTQNTDTGTTSPTFQIDSGNSGPKIKNNAGTLEARNAADDAYVDLRALSYYGDGSNLTDVGSATATGLTIDAKEENTGSIVKGQPIYNSGSAGAAISLIGLADCDDPAKYHCIGLAAETISQNGNGTVRVGGVLTGVDTLGTNEVNPNGETWVASDILYLDDTAGGLTNVKPTVGHVVEVGHSLFGSSNTDAILVHLSRPRDGIRVATGEDIELRLGDSAGVNKIIIKDYANNPVGSWDSDGEILSLNIKRNKLDATQAPTVNNDVDEGYAAGSVWVDITNDKGYLCLDNTDGAAVWIEVTLAGSGYTNLTSFVDQTAWRVFYSNADGDVKELALGADGTYLKSNGADQNPSFGTPAGAGDMLKATYDDGEDGIIDPESGGTGIANATTETITLVGDDAITLTTTAASNVTLPTTGTLATLTGDEVLTNKDIDFTNALGTDHFYSGQLDSQPVGESVVFGQLLYYDWTDVEWKLAKADAFATAKATRIALESKGNSETCLMLVKGYIRDDSAFDFGAARVFLNDDTAGTCDDTAPAESGDQIFVVGEAKSADILFFDPGKDVGEI